MSIQQLLMTAVLSALLMTNVLAANYDYVDPGDFYYINKFGDDNDYVVVVRKMGNGRVKVRDLNDGSTQVVDASKLLTKSQLDSEETTNFIGGTAIGIGILYCLANPGEC
jgi:hypothetical protein